MTTNLAWPFPKIDISQTNMTEHILPALMLAVLIPIAVVAVVAIIRWRD